MPPLYQKSGNPGEVWAEVISVCKHKNDAVMKGNAVDFESASIVLLMEKGSAHPALTLVFQHICLMTVMEAINVLSPTEIFKSINIYSETTLFHSLPLDI